LEKLAVMIPRPRINLLIYNGAFAPRGCCHSGPVVVEDAPHRVMTPPSGSASASPEAAAPPAAYVRPPYYALTCSAEFSRLTFWRAPTVAGGCACWPSIRPAAYSG
jgi:hypothetical protein